MTVYVVMVSLICIYGLLFSKKRKLFLALSFGTMIIISGLRGMEIGKDLAHYIPNYTIIANTPWKELVFLSSGKGYDYGFIILCKILGCFSQDPQFFLLVTSIIIYSSVARYIYRYSEDVVLETIMFVATFLQFMFMTMIAQALALCVILYGIDYLIRKRYCIFALFVLLATTIHGTAIFCMIFIPLSIMKTNRKNVIYVTILAIASFALFDYLLDFALKYIVPGYSWYTSSKWGSGIEGSELNIFFILFYGGILLLSYMSISSGKGLRVSANRTLRIKRRYIEVPQLSANFCIYMTLISLLARILMYKMAVIERLAYYSYLFAHTLLCMLIAKSFSRKEKMIIKLFLLAGLFLLFFFYAPRVGVDAYGVVPYKFFWQ